MTNKELAKQLKHSSPNHIYVITWYNLLKQLHCPLQVLVLENIGNLKKGQIVSVTKVKVTRDLKRVFIIENQAYYYHYFDIIV